MQKTFLQCCLTSCCWTAYTFPLTPFCCETVVMWVPSVYDWISSNPNANKKLLPRRGVNFLLLQPFCLLDLGLSILHGIMQNAVKFMILQLTLLVLAELSFPFPHSLVKEQHLICLYSLVNAMSSFSLNLAALWIVLLPFFSCTAGNESLSSPFWDGATSGERERGKKKSGKENACSR